MENNSETKQYEIIEDIEQTKSSEIVALKDLETKAINTIVALVNQANIISSENCSMEERKKYEVKKADTYIDETDKSSKKAKEKYDKLAGMKTSHFWTIGRNKAKVEKTQEVLIDIIDAINNNANATKAMFNDQTKLAYHQKKLYGIGLMGIAFNRIVIREIKLRLENASKEELSELARQELEDTVFELEKQLKFDEKIDGVQKDIIDRVEDVNNTIISNKEHFNTLIKELKEAASQQEKSFDENKKAFNEKIEDVNNTIISNKEHFNTLIKELKEAASQQEKSFDENKKAFNEKIEGVNNTIISNKEHFNTLIKELKEAASLQEKSVDDNFYNIRMITDAHGNRLGVLENKSFVDSSIYKMFVGIAAFSALILSILLYLE